MDIANDCPLYLVNVMDCNYGEGVKSKVSLMDILYPSSTKYF